MNKPARIPPDQDFQLIGPMENAEMAPHSHFKVQRIWGFLLKYWWLPCLTVVVGLVVGGALVFWQPPTYVSKGSLCETVKFHLPEGAVFSEDSQTFLGTQTELLQSPTLREMTLERMATNGVRIPMGPDRQPLAVKIRVSASAKSSVYTLEATSSQAAYTQGYLRTLMEVFQDLKRNMRKEVSGFTLDSISRQVDSTERELKAEQDKLMDFQRTNNMAILQQEGASAGGYLTTLKTKLSDYQLEQRLLEATLLDQSRAANSTNASPDLLDTALLAGSSQTTGVLSERQSALKELEVLKIQRARLSKHLRPKHPKIVKLDADIERSEKLLEVFRKQDHDQLAAGRQGLQLKIENVQNSISEWGKKVIEANTLLAEGERLRINVQREQGIYDRLTMLMQNVGLSRSIEQENLTVLDQASPATRSYREEISILAVAGIGGLGIGLGILLLMVVRDDRFESAGEFNERLGELILGQVPNVLTNGANGPLPLLEAHDQRHAYAESYRNLRSAVLFMAIEGERPKVLLITSALPNEGKSTVAANLARALALGGARVVLMDGDLRKGLLHELMGLPRSPGLADALQAPNVQDQVIHINGLPNFAFIPSGVLASNSGDLFLSPAFDQLLARLREEFDYVIIDSSPVFAADDATTLAPKADATLFVVRNRYSRARPVREALELLYQRQAKIMGVIFNQADASARSYYYYKYAEYYGQTKARVNE
jgi:capsular exopolysaccharide synthesis family protein